MANCIRRVRAETGLLGGRYRHVSWWVLGMVGSVLGVRQLTCLPAWSFLGSRVLPLLDGVSAVKLGSGYGIAPELRPPAMI